MRGKAILRVEQPPKNMIVKERQEKKKPNEWKGNSTSLYKQKKEMKKKQTGKDERVNNIIQSHLFSFMGIAVILNNSRTRTASMIFSF